MERSVIYMLFDGRYHTDEDRATCFEVCDTLEEAKENKDDYGDDTVIVRGFCEDNLVVKSEIVY